MTPEDVIKIWWIFLHLILLIYWCNNTLKRIPNKPKLFKVCHINSCAPCFSSGRIFPILRGMHIYKWKPPSRICSDWKYRRLMQLLVEKKASHFLENIDEWPPNTHWGTKFEVVKLMWLYWWKSAINLVQNDILWMCGDIKVIKE